MTDPSDRYPDLLDPRDSDLERVIADLDTTFSTVTLPPERDAAIQAAMSKQAATMHAGAPRHRLPAIRLHAPRRLASAGLIAAMVLGAGGAYLHSQGATAVSAQTVLRHAATAGISATQAAHSVYRLTSSQGDAATADVWVEADASGSPVAFALTQYSTKGGASQLTGRIVRIGNTEQSYDAGSNTVHTSPAGTGKSALAIMFVGPFSALHLSQITSQNGVRLLSPTTLDGVNVDVLEDPNGNIFYFDAQSYVLRGIDWIMNGQSWRARLQSYATVPLAAVPADAFTLNAPAGAHPAVQDQGAQDFLSLMAGVCRSTPQAVLSDMQSHRDSTGLQICRDTNPSISADQLIAALLAPIKAHLDADVAAGRITSQDEAAELANGGTKMHYFVSTPVRMLSILNP